MKYVKAMIGAALLIILDQVTKYWAASVLKGNKAIEIWNGVFEFQYLENRGMAFGLMQNQIILFVIFTVIILGVIFYYYRLVPDTKRMMPLRWAMVVLAAGAVGNLIDRIVNNYVIDFLYFKFIDFPIFNVADCYVTISLLTLICLILFYYKEEELEFHGK